MKIAIIILHYKNLEDTQECLNSCQKIDYPFYKIIVVCNGTPQEHYEKLKKQFGDQITLIQNKKNLGFAGGNNIGIRYALKDTEIKYVILLNNDTLVEPNFTREMVNKVKREKVDMVASRMMDYYNRSEIDNLGILMCRSGLTFNIKEERDKLFCPSGGCVLYSRELLGRVGLRTEGCLPKTTGYLREKSEYFDKDFFCYSEDWDLGFRALVNGFKPGLAKEAIVYHKGSRAFGKMSDFAIYHTYRNTIWVLVKNLPTPLFLKYLPWLTLGQLGLLFLYLLRGKPGLILKAWFAAIKKLPCILRERKIIQKGKRIKNKELERFITPKLFPF